MQIGAVGGRISYQVEALCRRVTDLSYCFRERYARPAQKCTYSRPDHFFRHNRRTYRRGRCFAVLTFLRPEFRSVLQMRRVELLSIDFRKRRHVLQRIVWSRAFALSGDLGVREVECQEYLRSRRESCQFGGIVAGFFDNAGSQCPYLRGYWEFGPRDEVKALGVTGDSSRRAPTADRADAPPRRIAATGRRRPLPRRELRRGCCSWTRAETGPGACVAASPSFTPRVTCGGAIPTAGDACSMVTARG